MPLFTHRKSGPRPPDGLGPPGPVYLFCLVLGVPTLTFGWVPNSSASGRYGGWTKWVFKNCGPAPTQTQDDRAASRISLTKQTCRGGNLGHVPPTVSS